MEKILEKMPSLRAQVAGQYFTFKLDYSKVESDDLTMAMELSDIINVMLKVMMKAETEAELIAAAEILQIWVERHEAFMHRQGICDATALQNICHGILLDCGVALNIANL